LQEPAQGKGEAGADEFCRDGNFRPQSFGTGGKLMAQWRSFCMRSLAVPLAAALIGIAPVAAQASQLLLLAEDVPAGLDIDGPSIAIPTTQEGMVQLLEPLIDYAPKGPDADGVIVPDFSKPRGRLLESWAYDPKTLTWTLHLRHGVKSCAGNTFTADDVLYT